MALEQHLDSSDPSDPRGRLAVGYRQEVREKFLYRLSVGFSVGAGVCGLGTFYAGYQERMGSAALCLGGGVALLAAAGVCGYVKARRENQEKGESRKRIITEYGE